MDKLLSFVQNNRGFLLVVGLLVVAFLLLRNRPARVASLAELDALIGHGQPVIIEFYSNT